MKTLAIAAAILAGCTSAPDDIHVSPDAKVSYLVVGMEHSGRFGDCPGCELDAKRITNMIKSSYGYEGETLISDQAFKSTVVRKLRSGIERTPEDGLFLFFYSGHGGQENLGGKEPDGSDRKDEFLCLYDDYMMDDEIWDIVSKCKGRVFLYFDACHSATMYRSVKPAVRENGGNKAKALEAPADAMEKTKGFRFRPERFARASALGAEVAKPSPRMLCWSGCDEPEYSFGGKKGGVMTICMLSNWKSGMSYGSLWEKTDGDVRKYQPGQHPVQTCVGDFQKGTEVFK